MLDKKRQARKEGYQKNYELFSITWAQFKSLAQQSVRHFVSKPETKKTKAQRKENLKYENSFFSSRFSATNQSEDYITIVRKKEKQADLGEFVPSRKTFRPRSDHQCLQFWTPFPGNCPSSLIKSSFFQNKRNRKRNALEETWIGNFVNTLARKERAREKGKKELSRLQKGWRNLKAGSWRERKKDEH